MRQMLWLVGGLLVAGCGTIEGYVTQAEQKLEQPDNCIVKSEQRKLDASTYVYYKCREGRCLDYGCKKD